MGATGGGGGTGATGGAAGGWIPVTGATGTAAAGTPATEATATAPKYVEPPKDDPASWTVYVTNDNCPDYTWGLTEAQTRQAFADIVRAHLDEMNRTDKEPAENQDRYNAAATNEVLCFVEKYPDRKDELVRRIKEWRLYVSPYLCNSLWGFQSTEAAIRTFYPWRRLEIGWGLPQATVAEHIEEPSLPWGTASILAGSGIRWLSVPFYTYDSTFNTLNVPPLFVLEGPDGSRLRVVMDTWASGCFSYTQGARALAQPQSIVNDWLPYYRLLGKNHGPASILASGTHGDISPTSGGAARGFAESIARYNASEGPHPKLVNATVPMFCAAVDEVEEGKPFLTARRGDFGHSWDVWPVSLARYAADMREAERRFLGAEALLALAAATSPKTSADTAAIRERAEWCWAMLADHAWNGTDEKNQRHNADLRKKWGEELAAIARAMSDRGWRAAGLEPDAGYVTLFNAISVPRADLVRCEVAPGVGAATEAGGQELPGQVAQEDGKRVLYFVAPATPGFGLKTLGLGPSTAKADSGSDKLRATPGEMESPFYKLTVDPRTGGVATLVYKATGANLVAARGGRTLCQTVYWRGREEQTRDVKSEVSAEGPVFARLRITSSVAGIAVTSFVTVYADLDRVDFDVRITKPAGTAEERLMQMFPIMPDGAALRADTTGAIVRPRWQPQGDLMAGADTTRMAVQGFIDASARDGPGVTVAPIDAFCLRLDQEVPAFEAIGNDQNYREVVKDQNGVAEFRFRYAVRGHGGAYDPAEAAAWSRTAAAPIMAAAGRMRAGALATVEVDPARAVALGLKPALDEKAGGIILRVWNTDGREGPLPVKVTGFKRAVQTDLLERDVAELAILDGVVPVDLKVNGFAAVRLVP